MLNKIRLVTITAAMIFALLIPALSVSASTPIKVAFVGDSITYGSGLSDPTNGSYPTRVGRLLGSAYEIRNFGVPNKTMLKQGNDPYWNTTEFTDSKAWLPDVVVIMLGTNDALPGNWNTLSGNFAADYTDMVNTYKNLSSHPKVYINKAPKPYTNGYPISDVTIAAVNAKIVQVARDTQSALTDVYAATSGMPQNFPDTVHPNDIGAQAIANAVYSTLRSNMTNDNDSRLTYSAGWAVDSARGVGDYNDDVHYATANGSSVEFTFDYAESRIDVIAEKNSDQGNVDVYIDNVFQQTVNCYNATRISQAVIYSKTGLSAGPHTIKLVKTSGSFIVIDGFKTAFNLVNDSNAGIGYAGTGWMTSSGRGVGDWQDDAHATTANGASVSFAFTGTRIDYISETYSDQGDVEVYIDNVFQQTINLASATRFVQVTAYSKSGLSYGTHTIKLVKASGTFMLIDAFLYQ
ncbi:GDSL-type esterase/lipase family protein [Cohnella soli]|uniref:GDSL-type esterase/lipase family protein n=1 Tax=Cohnella soli TaxID=425005 RepID=A0ABW0I467_9BACL